jgi:hypothetical protein
MVTRKLTRGQVRSISLKILKEQGGVCAISGKPIDTSAKSGASSMCLDHDHRSGLVRGVLSRGVNGAEGKVYNAVARWAGYGQHDVEGICQFLENMAMYLRKEPYPYIYPTHLSDEEKKLKAAAKARKARATKKAAQEIKK